MRRKPAHCSNAFGPSRGTSFSALRDCERAVGVAVRDDALRQACADARHARQQRRRGGVDVDADRVDAVLDHGIERPGELGLADVVLILADADRLRLDLHELGERILQAARDRDRAAQGHVEIGQLLRGEAEAE